jgi:glutathione S-transferase
MNYELYYWPGIPGRGEYVRLALEAVGQPYADIAQNEEDTAEIAAKVAALLKDNPSGWPAFAPPALKAGDLVIAQTANILHYVGAKHDLAPKTDAGQFWVHQLQLTVADLVDEAHNTHHPLGPELYYEEQKDEAARMARNFRAHRLPKYLAYFTRVLEQNTESDKHLAGQSLTYPDLSLYHTLEGLHYAFPRAMAGMEADYPLLGKLRTHVGALPRIVAYRESGRCQAFNENGMFRHYPELDSD